MLIDKINEHLQVFEDLKAMTAQLDMAAKAIANCAKDERTVFVCGNGGSAADAQHFAAELTGRYVSDRRSYASVALTVDTSALTAIGNDYGFERVFSRQLEGLGRDGDVLIAISTSGNSANVIEAVKVAKAKNMAVVGLLGRDGGQLKSMVDVALISPSNVTARIQETHIFMLHYFCEQLED